MLSDIRQVELDAAESKILVALFGSTEPGAKAQWLMNFLGIRLNEILQEFEYLIRPMMDDQGLVDGRMMRELLGDKFPMLAQVIPPNPFRLVDIADPLAKLLEILKGKLL